MPANKLPTEEINRNGASTRCLRVIYLAVKYEENRKSPISVSAFAAEIQRKEVMPAIWIANTCIPSG
jgi:hypothetical protein